MLAKWSSLAWRRILVGPVATLAAAKFALFLAAVPGLPERAQFARATLLSEPWRLLTSHFAHFSTTHLVYDLVVFIGLGIACEMRWPARTRMALAASVFAIPLVFLVAEPGLETYRGLSGLGSALLILLVTRLHMERAFSSAWTRHLPLLTCVGFLAKVSYEVATGAALFVDQSALFEPVPSAHLAGALVGLFVAVLPARLMSPARPRKADLKLVSKTRA